MRTILELIKDNQAHYVDLNTDGTVNLTNNVGVQVGYRSFISGTWRTAPALRAHSR